MPSMVCQRQQSVIVNQADPVIETHCPLQDHGGTAGTGLTFYFRWVRQGCDKKLCFTAVISHRNLVMRAYSLNIMKYYLLKKANITS